MFRFLFIQTRAMATGCPCKSTLVLIAKGTEEIECITVVDVLRRAGIRVHLAGMLGKDPVTCKSESVICPDMSFKEAIPKAPFDAIILPGGLDGAKAFADSCELCCMLQEQDKACRIVAAICAAPTALVKHKVGCGKRITSYPSVKEEITKDKCYTYVDNEKVVVDGHIITSQGPATAMQFALKIVEQLSGKDKALETANGLLFDYSGM